MLKNLSETRVKGIWNRIDRSGGDAACWPWMGGLSCGYGRIHIRGKGVLVTHVMLEWDGRPKPSPGLFACHRCDNPRCCNPRHLWWDTQRANIQDASRKGRMKTGVPKINVPAMVAMHQRGATYMELAQHFSVHVGSIYRAFARVRSGYPDGRGRH